MGYHEDKIKREHEKPKSESESEDESESESEDEEERHEKAEEEEEERKEKEEEEGKANEEEEDQEEEHRDRVIVKGYMRPDGTSYYVVIPKEIRELFGLKGGEYFLIKPKPGKGKIELKIAKFVEE